MNKTIFIGLGIIFSILISSLVYALQPIPVSGLFPTEDIIGLWQFNESGDDACIDDTGRYNGTATDTTLRDILFSDLDNAYLGQTQGYFNFNSVSVLGGNNDVTICAWANISNADQNYLLFDGNNRIGFFQGEMTVYDGGSFQDCGAGTSWVGLPRFFCWKITNLAVECYVNGTNLYNASIGTAMSDIIEYIGMAGNNDFTGHIDSMVYFNSSLTAGNISTLWDYTSGSAPAPPGGGGSLLVNITYPLEDEHINSDYFLTVDINVTGNCSINDSNWPQSSGNGTSFNFTYSGTPSEEEYSFFINCTNGSLVGNDTRNFYVDYTDPVITPNPDLLNNNTYVWNGSLTTYINFSDNIEIYSINVTADNGSAIFGHLNLGATFYQLNISHGVEPTTEGSINARVCDTHTAKEIKSMDYEIDKRGLKYLMPGHQDEFIHIYPKEYINYNNPDTTKLKDRYTYTFNRAGIVAGTEVFIVESSSFIDIIKSKSYGGHLVIPAFDRWVDFESDQNLGYNVQRISDNKVEVRISGLIGTSFLFNSIGELNCINETFYYTNLNPAIGYISDVIEGTTNEFNLSVTGSGYITQINATLYYDNQTIYLGNESNFTGEATAPEIETGLNDNKTFYFLLGINGETINLTNLKTDQIVYNRFLNNCSNSSINYTSLIVEFINLSSSSQQHVEVILTVEGDLNYYQTWSNLSNFSLCIYPSMAELEESITIQYGGTGQYNYYNFDTTLTNITQSLTLYLEEDPQETTFTIMDKETSELLEDVYGTMYRLINGTWQVIEAKYSDITGRIKFSYQEDIKYKFFLSKSRYVSKVFYLDPVLFSEYDILMDRNFTLNTSQDYDRIALVYYPEVFYDNQTNNFTFMISSPFAELETYGYTLTYPGGTLSNNGTTGIGEELTSSFNITGASSGDQLTLFYFYDGTVSGHRNFTKYYDIIVTVHNNTMIDNRNKTYGLGLFERLIVIVLAVLFVVGIASLVGQPLPGLFIGLGVYIYAVYIGFIPLWTILISVTIGLIILGSRPEG